MGKRPTVQSRRRPAADLRVVLALALLGAAAGCSPEGGSSLTQRISVATGGTGGVYYPYGGGVAQVISDHVAGVEEVDHLRRDCSVR